MAARCLALMAALAASLLFLAGCGAPAALESNTYSMGTVCSQHIYGSQTALSGGTALLEELDSALAWRNTESEIAQLNQAGTAALSPTAYAAVKRALELAESTGGAFDPTLGVLTREWNISDADTARILTRQEAAALTRYVDYRAVTLDDANRTVTLGQGQALDLGGMAKGYASDALAAYYRESGVSSGFVNLGGNVTVVGKRPDGAAYTVGVRDPAGSASDLFATVQVQDASVVISGAYERYIEGPDGAVYHHILDPSTGYPAESDLLSSCIISADAALADAFSTAVFVLGSEAGMALVERTEGAECLLLRKDGRILMSAQFEALYAPTFVEGKPYAR